MKGIGGRMLKIKTKSGLGRGKIWDCLNIIEIKTRGRCRGWEFVKIEGKIRDVLQKADRRRLILTIKSSKSRRSVHKDIRSQNPRRHKLDRKTLRPSPGHQTSRQWKIRPLYRRLRGRKPKSRLLNLRIRLPWRRRIRGTQLPQVWHDPILRL